jgi:hypothetical protein
MNYFTSVYTIEQFLIHGLTCMSLHLPKRLV